MLPMLAINNETDIEILRQKAALLDNENRLLHRRLAELTARLDKLEGKDATSLQHELKLLTEKLRANREAMFGRSSERRPKADDNDDDGKSGESGKDAGRKRPARPGHGPTAQPDLPIVEHVHDLDEADKVCPICGLELNAIAGQFETSELITVVERRFEVHRVKLTKSTCASHCGIETALPPDKPIKGGRYSTEFAVEVAVGKYGLHLPLSRQVREMAEQGLKVTSQTLWDQIFALYLLLVPSYQALREQVLAAPVVGADETTWRMMGSGNRKKWYAWVITTATGAVYHIDPSRSAKAAAALLKGYGGVVMTDGYAAYEKLRRLLLQKQRYTFDLVSCWAHVRRRFVKCEADYPEAAEVLALIGKLYEIEKKARAGPFDDPLDALRHLAWKRKEESKPVVAEIQAWRSRQHYLPSSSFGSAVQYMDELWVRLIKFLDDPRVTLDNNASERAMRAPVLGRKNHYGSRSKKGTDVAALFYSLTETCKLVGISPREYIAEAARRALRCKGTVTLPADLLAERQAKTDDSKAE